MFDLKDMSIEELEAYACKIEDHRDNFFEEGEFYPGDQGYQDILQELTEIRDEIESRKE